MSFSESGPGSDDDEYQELEAPVKNQTTPAINVENQVASVTDGQTAPPREIVTPVLSTPQDVQQEIPGNIETPAGPDGTKRDIIQEAGVNEIENPREKFFTKIKEIAQDSLTEIKMHNRGISKQVKEEGEDAVCHYLSVNINYSSNPLDGSVARYFMRRGYCKEVASHLGKFESLEPSIATRLIESGDSNTFQEIIRNKEKFPGLTDGELATTLIENGGSKSLGDNLSSFKDLEPSIADSLLRQGLFSEVIHNIASFNAADGDIARFRSLDPEFIKEIFLSGDVSIEKLDTLLAEGFIDSGEVEKTYRLFFQGNPKLLEKKESYYEGCIALFSRIKVEDYPAQIKLYKEIFGEVSSASAYGVLDSLLRGQLNPELQILGITETGERGIKELWDVSNELRRSFNTVAISQEELKLLEESKLARDLLLNISGFKEGRWGGSGDEALLRKIQSINRTILDGIFTDKPKELQPSRVYEINKLGAKEAEKSLSEDAILRYKVLKDDVVGAIQAVQEKGGMGKLVEEIRGKLSGISSKIDSDILKYHAEGNENAVNGLKIKKEALSKYLETIDLSSRRNPNIPTEVQAKFVLNSPVSFQRALSLLGKYEELYSPIRKLVFAGVLRKYPGQAERLSQLSEDPTIEDLSSMTEFVNHIVGEETYGDYFSGDGKLAKTFERISSTEALDQGLKHIQEEAPRIGKTEIQFLPTRGLMLEMSGQIGDACWADKYTSVGEAMPNMSAIIMRARPDSPAERIIGAALLIDSFIPETGEKVLVLRGVNPRENYINSVESTDFYNAITDYVREIAEKRQMIPAVVLDDHCGGSGTNRPALFSTMQSRKPNSQKVVVDYNSTFFNGYDVTGKTYRLDQ